MNKAFAQTLIVLFSATLALADGSIIDEIVFGNFTSENFHHATTVVNSSSGTGALGQTYRQLDHYTPSRDDGGKITFNMSVDPAAQNYLTLKLWGSDYCQTARSTHLYLYYNGQQLGYRDHADWPPLDANWENPEFPDRFYYTTYMLPRSMTQGKSTVVLTIQSWGYWWPYGDSWDECQRTQDEPSRGIYKAYTHTDPFFEPPASEPQGNPVPLGEPRPTDDQYNSVLEKLIDDADSIVAIRKVSTEPIPTWRMLGMARAYNAVWSMHYHDELLITKIINDLDYWVEQVAASGDEMISDNQHDDWSGYGRLAIVVLEMLDHFNNLGLLDELIDHDGQTGTAEIARGQAYAEFFRNGRDWRMQDRRWITNQVLDCELSIYLANKVLQQLDPAMAWEEQYALQTVYEAIGLLPFGHWLYNATLDTDYYRQQVIWNSLWPYHMITKKGLARETGYVAYYGNQGDALARLAKYTGDELVKQQAIRFVRARAPFRFYDNDEQGHVCMRIEAAIGARKINQTGLVQYNDWTGFETAAVLQDPVSVRLAQLYLEHNRVWTDDIDIEDEVQRVSDYLTVAALPPSEYHFPMAPGSDDFAWADEENGVIAVKRGDTRFYANLYFRMSPVVNQIGRVHYTTPTIDRVANISVACEFTPTGESMTRSDNPAHPEWTRRRPPAELDLHSFHAGETLPAAQGALPGRAEFYHFQYEFFLVGMNTTPYKTFELPLPANCPSAARDLITGQMINLADPIEVGPGSTVILYLAEPQYCGDTNTVYLEADFNRDCIVNLPDLAAFADDWLETAP